MPDRCLTVACLRGNALQISIAQMVVQGRLHPERGGGEGGGGLHWRGPSGGKQRFAVRVVWQGLPAEGLARPEAHGRHSEQHRYA